MTNHIGNEEERDIGAAGSWAMRVGAVLALVGLGGGLLMVWKDIDGAKSAFPRSYLTAFEFVTTICLGGLFFMMLGYAVRSGWNVAFRRVTEAVAGNLMYLPLLFIPVAMMMWRGQLYEWWTPEHRGDYSPSKAFYLSDRFWLIRSALYLGIWAFLAWYFTKQSSRQDQTGDVSLTHKMQSRCYPALILFALTQSLAGMDWVMSLSPKWFSTMFPVYYFAASACGFFSVQIITVFLLQRAGKLKGVTVEHYQDMGKLLFAFGVVFWAYIAFSQFMLIWYADLPEETPWYLARFTPGWISISWGLLLAHFAVPFLFMISRHPKRAKPVLALMAVWMLAMHYMDVTWLVKPIVPEEAIKAATSYQELMKTLTPEQVGFTWSLLDVALLIGMAGLLMAGTAYRLSRVSLVPVRDPRLSESLAFENM